VSQGAPVIQTIGRYKVLGELGRGAMGVVYKAEDPNIGRTVALKTQRLDVQGEESQELLRRLRQEARSAGILNHPNIVTIYDAGEQDALFFIAMEYIEGTTLQSMLTPGKPMPLDQVVEIARQVCAGLDYAHQRQIVHRDVKPANIMITPEGSAKVMDFGIAKTGSGMTSAGQVLGTPSYMSPEQVKGKPLDGRSDIFSVGVILYEAVTGQKPFTGDNITTIIYKIVNEEPIPPRDLDLSVHPGLNKVITRALSKNLDERYQRGWDLARDLANYKSLAVDAPVDDASDKTVILSTQQLNAQSIAAVAGQEFTTGPAPAMASAATAAAPAVAVASAKVVAAAPAKIPAAAAKPQPITHPKSPLPMVLIAAALTVVVLAGIGLNSWRKNKAAQQAATQTVVQQPAAPAQTPPAPPPVAEQPKATPTDQQPSATAPAASTPTQTTSSTTPAPPKKVAKAPAKSPAKTETKTAAVPTAPVITPAPLTLNGQLRVVSIPVGADVTVDGKPQPSQTPLTLPEMAPGVHTVVISKTGFRPETRNIEVKRGDRAQVNAILVSSMASVTLNSTPVGASVFVDGSETGKLTPAQIQVPEGSHKITLKLQGWHTAETNAMLKPGDAFSFAPVLSKDSAARPFGFFRKVFGPGDPATKGTLIIRTRPPGATVLVDGTEMPRKTPIPRAPMEPGKYHVTVKLQGYKTLERDVTIVKGQVVDLSGPLEKQ